MLLIACDPALEQPKVCQPVASHCAPGCWVNGDTKMVTKETKTKQKQNETKQIKTKQNKTK